MVRSQRQVDPPKPLPEPPSTFLAQDYGWPALLALCAAVATWATVAPDLGGPGVTCDELYHVAYGKRLVCALSQQGLGFFRPESLRAHFNWEPDGPPVHPPLGNLILGVVHRLFDPRPDDPQVVVIPGARFASGWALGLLVLIVGWSTVRTAGRLAGNVAAASVVLVPRVFGHAHLAALDMWTAALCVGAVLSAAEVAARPARWWHWVLAGGVGGLACLTRLHGMLVAPPVIAWLVWRLRQRALWPALVWSMSGLAVLCLGWPWLWLAPVKHLALYLGSGTARQPVHVFYAGHVWNDVDTPWHYPLVMFLAVLPLGLLVLGALGIWARVQQRSDEPRLVLALGTAGFVLGVFCWPGTPVYDGVRLFLLVFPLWAMAVGLGAKWLVERGHWAFVPRPWRAVAVGTLVALQGTGLWAYQPAWLSHYSLLVGGLAGGERLGLEVTYWGDAVPEWLLAEGARRAAGGRLLFAPNLAPFHAPAVGLSSPSLSQHQVAVVGWEQGWNVPPAGCRYAILFQRKADLAQVPAEWLRAPVVAQYAQQGVWLARLIELPAAEPE